LASQRRSGERASLACQRRSGALCYKNLKLNIRGHRLTRTRPFNSFTW
jgi:hypothetical protein